MESAWGSLRFQMAKEAMLSAHLAEGSRLDDVSLATLLDLVLEQFGYPNAIQDVFGSYVQHGVIIKNYVDPNVGRYTPPEIKDCDRRRIQFVEDLWTICTSHVERFNCTTRMFVKRFCRLTLAFSKKLANLNAAVSLYIAYYNWCWRSRENDGPKAGRFRLTPAMQAGLADRLWKIEDLYDAVMAA